MKSFDVAVIGAGHNGLAAAAMLAKSGRRVVVLEASARIGGLGGAVEFAPGFSGSLSPALYRLPASVEKALELERHGFKHGGLASTVTLSADAPAITLSGAWGEQVSGVPAGEAEAFAQLRKRLLKQASVLGAFDGEPPIGPQTADLGAKAKIARVAMGMRMSGADEFRQFLRMALMCVADVADEVLDDDRLKGLTAFDATLGIRLGPRSPTSLLGLYHRLSGESGGRQGGMTIPVGGMAAVMEAFASAARVAGAEVRTASPVARIDVEAGTVTGVTLVAGETIVCRTVLSATSPLQTFGRLLPGRELDTGFASAIKSLRSKGNVSKLFIALDRPPQFHGDIPARHVHAPSIRAIEDSFNPQKYGELPADPPFELIVEQPDTQSAKQGAAAILSISIANTPHDLKEGWDKGRHALTRAVIARLEAASPGIGNHVLAAALLSPVEIGDTFGSPGGHWHHHELQADRLYALRPVFGTANYRAPVGGLWHCGAGAHPGGGISGISGVNAAREIMASERGQ